MQQKNQQKEKCFEKEWIEYLSKIGYENLGSINEKQLLDNFKIQIEKLNANVLKNKPLTESQFDELTRELFANTFYSRDSKGFLDILKN
ncbi:hypothetical protein ['Camptotheca acuminata' phytoplasma]|uniref:hypothetical protein n=1 Tax='Camptotheca acuminata' phytoplasma TaxID=3239192 RepID=UPI00351A2EDC